MPERTNRIGRHLPTSGSLGRTLQMAKELECETAQIFVSNPHVFDTPYTHPPTLTVTATR